MVRIVNGKIVEDDTGSQQQQQQHRTSTYTGYPTIHSLSSAPQQQHQQQAQQQQHYDGASSQVYPRSFNELRTWEVNLFGRSIRLIYIAIGAFVVSLFFGFKAIIVMGLVGGLLYLYRTSDSRPMLPLQVQQGHTTTTAAAAPSFDSSAAGRPSSRGGGGGGGIRTISDLPRSDPTDQQQSIQYSAPKS